MSVPQFFISLLVILAAAKIGSETAERAHLPSVLGELVAGIIVGAGIFAPLSAHISFLRPVVIHASNSTLELLGQLGAVMLLFEVGLESDIQELRRLGLLSIWLASAGALFSFALGFLAGHILGLPTAVAAFLGASITATSVGISVRTFQDLGQTQSGEAKLVLGAAVADDVLGLIILASVTSIVTVGAVSAIGVVKITVIAILFLVGAIVVGTLLTPQILRFAAKMRSRAALPTVALVICLFFAVLAIDLGGLSPIIGAFAAGLVLSQSKHKLHLQRRLKPVASIFIPIFFVVVGAAMSVTALNPATSSGRAVLLLAVVLTIVAVAAKLLAAFTLPTKLDRLVIGCGMSPRGEVSLIFAAYGIRSHLLTDSLYSVILVVIMLTTFLTPPAIKFGMRRRLQQPRQPAIAPDPNSLDNNLLCELN
jgi:Kef-type K+ transport system membrane component KefB